MKGIVYIFPNIVVKKSKVFGHILIGNKNYIQYLFHFSHGIYGNSSIGYRIGIGGIADFMGIGPIVANYLKSVFYQFIGAITRGCSKTKRKTWIAPFL